MVSEYYSTEQVIPRRLDDQNNRDFFFNGNIEREERRSYWYTTDKKYSFAIVNG